MGGVDGGGERKRKIKSFQSSDFEYYKNWTLRKAERISGEGIRINEGEGIGDEAPRKQRRGDERR